MGKAAAAADAAAWRCAGARGPTDLAVVLPSHACAAEQSIESLTIAGNAAKAHRAGQIDNLASEFPIRAREKG